MDTAQLLVALLGAGGGGAVLLALVNGLIKWLSGASARERDRNTNLESQRKKAIEEREAAENEREQADLRRRQAYEYASTLRRQLIENGIPVEDWPLDRTIPQYKVKELKAQQALEQSEQG